MIEQHEKQYETSAVNSKCQTNRKPKRRRRGEAQKPADKTTSKKQVSWKRDARVLIKDRICFSVGHMASNCPLGI